MNTSGLNTLFKLAPKIREILLHSSPSHENADLMSMFEKEIDGFETAFGDALTAYSTQGYSAAPQPYGKYEYKRTAFNWHQINLYKRTHITPTNYQLLRLRSSVLFIQYMITGGFKSDNITLDNIELATEFDEAHNFLNSLR